ncbi:cytochrome P450 [Colletotrichum abscissum]|uniref:cytochrome P450 n=1 Tax=Colletotrichum abscissum TaxID=1671311 RepID=UPI0027D70B3D|nr:cytochrome P450 [Colletotrichum abscissum]KAK1486520.1 cytochrome P450 [Colletotrichum abscissum]
MSKLVSKVRLTFKTEDKINITFVNKLSYMLVCLDEALWIYLLVVMGLPWAIHHNETYFKDPFSFRPERFLGDPEFATDKRDVFQPFHIGARNCLEDFADPNNLAYVKMQLILAHLTWNFDMELAEESRGWAEKQKVYILWEKGPLEVHLSPVQRV